MYNVKEITSEEAHVVRHPVLRPGKPFETAIFPEDVLDGTFHVGILNDGKPVGTMSMIRKNNSQLEAENAYQLRGMAILHEHQRKGLGEMIVQKAEEMVLEKGGTLIWLNAREVALGFYKKMGYEISGDEFMVPGIGLHFLMFKNLNL
ncbi:GNAT family N-acetyltransferase [Galbibacter sp. EGI 63066]|uniref:GNAT family N-acetyltransferase n=1 Tax=Galbibacter sp. EGI 63066 TaxID=2993559 RepID=UPI002248C7CC|nr:GNAT family N-acetyltransferase [Galbibacter sp. EGI 63066]MCX2680398.1 GNAT family N-acetyltransferase [Galbibacter sp. EGI 63066]